MSPRHLSRVVLVALAHTLFSVPALAAPLTPTKPVPLLGGRVTIKLSANAEDTPRGPESVMAAAPSQSSETRVFIPVDGGKLVVYATETFGTKPPTDEPLLAAFAAPKLGAKPVAERAGALRMIRQNPSQWVAVIDGGELVDSAFVILPDDTIINIDFFVAPSAKDKDTLRTFVRAALATIEYKHKLKTGGALVGDDISVTLPSSWIQTRLRGPDFEVVRATKLVPFGAKDVPRVGLYIGGHASYQHEQQRDDEDDGHGHAGKKPPMAVEKKKGKWLGREIEWHLWGTPRVGEAILDLGKRGVRHVWYSGDDARAIVDQMKLKP